MSTEDVNQIDEAIIIGIVWALRIRHIEGIAATVGGQIGRREVLHRGQPAGRIVRAGFLGVDNAHQTAAISVSGDVQPAMPAH